MLGVLPWFVEKPDPSIYLRGRYVVLDYETTILEKGSSLRLDNRIVLAVWKCSWKTHVTYSWKGEYGLAQLVSDIGQADFLVAQNAKFELGWLKRCGAKIESMLVYDTMLAHYNLSANRSWPCNFDALVAYYKVGRIKTTLFKSLLGASVCPSTWPKSWLKQYCINDVLTEEKIFLKQRKVLDEKGLLPTLYTKCLFVPVLAEIELTGMYVDKVAVKNEYERVCQELLEKEALLSQITGGINFRSPKQVREFMYDTISFTPLKKYKKVITTATGQLPTSEATILALKCKTKRQGAFRDAYIATKKLASSLSKILSELNRSADDTCRIHANYNQTISRTGRLSSTKKPKSIFYSIQLQNPPRKYKPLFTTREKGSKIVEIDFAGFEFTVAAILAKDKRALEDIQNPDFDIHTCSASACFGLNLPTFKKGTIQGDVRDSAKPKTFGPLYGKSTGSEEDLKWISVFRERYSGIYDMQRRWEEEVMRTGQLVLPTGLIFHWPDYANSITAEGTSWEFPKVCNYGVQCISTAEGTPLALVCQWHRMKSLGMKAFINGTLHDSMISDVPDGELEKFCEIGIQSFTKDVAKLFGELYNIEMVIPLDIEITTRANWNAPLDKDGKEYNPFY